MNLRLVKVACPQCGAGMRLDPRAQMVTCSYCGLSSFVHRQDQPAPAPPNDGQKYGTIKVNSAKARNVLLIVVLAFVIVPFLIFGLVFAFIFGVIGKVASDIGGHGKHPTTTTTTTITSGDEGGGSVCAQTAACCKVIVRASSAGANADAVRACEGMRVLAEAQCKSQLETLRKSAEQLGKKCE